MQQYRSFLRHSMTKQMIHECQAMLKVDSSTFGLLRQIEKIQSEIVANSSLFDNSILQVKMCLSAVTNILKPFEQSQSIWGDKVLSNGKPGSVHLGFLGNEDISNINEEEMKEEDEEDEDDEGEDD